MGNEQLGDVCTKMFSFIENNLRIKIEIFFICIILMIYDIVKSILYSDYYVKVSGNLAIRIDNYRFGNGVNYDEYYGD